MPTRIILRKIGFPPTGGFGGFTFGGISPIGLCHFIFCFLFSFSRFSSLRISSMLVPKSDNPSNPLLRLFAIHRSYINPIRFIVVVSSVLISNNFFNALSRLT